LFGQFHLVAVVAGKSTTHQHVAGQLHLADHANLGIAGIAMLITGAAIVLAVVIRIRRAPDHAIDTEQAQTGPSGVIGAGMPALLSQGKDFSHRSAAQTLATLHDCTGCYQWLLPRQHDAHTARGIPGRHPAKQRHGDHAPDHGFKRETSLTQGRHSRRFQCGAN